MIHGTPLASVNSTGNCNGGNMISNPLTQKSMQLKLLLLTVIVLGGLVACGPQKSGVETTDLGSNNGSGESFGTVNELYNNGYVACSRDVANNSDFAAKVMLFSDPITGIINPRYVRLKFDRFPGDYYGTSNNPSFAIWASTVSSNGVEAPAAQLSFGFEKHIVGFQPLGSGQTNYFGADWQDMKNLITYHSLSYTSGAAMMGEVTLLVDLGSYADAPNLVLKVSSYDTSLNLLKTLNILTPYFKANPNVYVTNHPLVLRNIHPLSYMSTGSWTQAQFVTESQKNCF